MEQEWVIRGGRVLTPEGLADADVRVAGSKIAEVAESIGGSFGREIDATGCLVLPGAVDAHVHFNDPGRAHWEGVFSGSRSLAAGGGTAFVDMPLNASPPTIDPESFALKKAAGEAGSVLDFALWGGLVPGNLDRMEELAGCGVVGFKAFMVDSGTEDFPGVDARVLRKGMRVAARLGLPVAVHAEDAAIIAERTEKVRSEGRGDARAFLESRPVESEVEAVRVALEIAGETGCALHVVHVSCPEAVALIGEARRSGRDVSVEVCPHHLLMNEGEMQVHGAFAKCAPPLRDEARRLALLDCVYDGSVDSIGSDHSPAPPDMKIGKDVMSAWGGIMGCQHGFPALLDEVLAKVPERLAEVWKLVSCAPAERLGLSDRKGEIAAGRDADLVLVRQCEPRIIAKAELLYRHKTSPYVGRTISCEVVATILRGRRVDFAAGDLRPGGGRFLARG